MIKRSEVITGIEKVDQECYSPFFLTLKQENIQQNEKEATSKLIKRNTFTWFPGRIAY